LGVVNLEHSGARSFSVKTKLAYILLACGIPFLPSQGKARFA